MPIEITWSKSFNYSSGIYKILLESYFSYSSKISIRNFFIRASDSNVSVQFTSIQQNSSDNTDIQNINVKGIANMLVTPDWINETLIAVIEVYAYNSSYFRISPPIHIDYQSLVNGMRIFISLLIQNFIFE